MAAIVAMAGWSAFGCASTPATTDGASPTAGSGGEAGGSAGATGGHDASAATDAGAGEAATPPRPLTCEGAVLDPRPWEECEGDGFCRCRGYAPDGGTLMLDNGLNSQMSITSMQLPVAMKAGQPYSLSADIVNSNFGGDIEFWGTTSECGSGLQKLFSAPIDSKIFCADVSPTQDFTYVLLVEGLTSPTNGKPAAEHAGNVLGCPTSRCPAVH
jgi:hypothetical protein